MDVGLCHQLAELVEELSRSGRPVLDEIKMKNVKMICKKSDSYVKHVFHMLMTLLREDHSEIRLSAFQMIDQLFMRSHCFRLLTVDMFQQVITLSVGTDYEQPLPPPKAAAHTMKQEALTAIKTWNEKFGSGYKKLSIGFNYLRKIKKVDFANLSVLNEVEQRQRQQIVINNSIIRINREINDIKHEIEQCLLETENCIKLIVPLVFDPSSTSYHNNDPIKQSSSNTADEISTQTECDSSSSDEDDDFVEVEDSLDLVGTVEDVGGSDRLVREHGLVSQRYSITININPGIALIHETHDNTDLINTLLDNITLIQSQYLKTVSRWMDVLTRSGEEQEKLREIIGIKMRLDAAVKQHDKLKIVRSSPRKRKLETPVRSLSEVESGAHSVDPTTAEATLSVLANKFGSLQPSQTLANSSVGSSGEKRRKMMEKAPVVSYGKDLDAWDPDCDHETPMVARNESSLHRFWRPVENPDYVDESLIAALKMRVMPYTGKFTPVKWTCRAPLPNGGLCSRQDRLKCPFHGNIIPRGQDGSPDTDINTPTSSGVSRTVKLGDTYTTPAWLDGELQRDIETVTGQDLGSKKNLKKSKKGKGRVKKSNLTDVKKVVNTSHSRLEKIVMNKSSLKRVSSELNSLEAKKHNDKFGDQFNYALRMK